MFGYLFLSIFLLVFFLLGFRNVGRGAGIKLSQDSIGQIVFICIEENHRRIVEALGGAVDHQRITAGLSLRCKNGSNLAEDILTHAPALVVKCAAGLFLVLDDSLLGIFDVLELFLR